MLDYWVGLGWIGYYCTIFRHRIIPSRGHLFMVWFGSVLALGRRSVRYINGASCNKGMLGCWDAGVVKWGIERVGME
jgi:hypothetical protein